MGMVGEVGDEKIGRFMIIRIWSEWLLIFVV